MEILALLPGLLAAWIGWRRSPAAAFLAAYLPALVLLPDYYYWNAPGLPDPSFVEAAIVPVAVFFLAREASSWRWSATDLLVLGFATFVGASEYQAAGYKEAQNLLFDCVAAVILPYALAKGLIEPKGLRVATAKRLVLLFFVASLVSIYEFRFGKNPWQMALGGFFPFQGTGWVVTVRWGFGRIGAAYGHAILAGIMLAVGFRLARWLEWSGAWPRRLPRLPWQPLATGRLLSLGVLAGLLMTMCRGPWLGAIAAALVCAIGRAKNRKRAAALVLAAVLGVGIPAFAAFKAYVSVGRSGAESATQETAAYRFELLGNYMDIVGEKPLLGWGRNTWPKVPGQPSIDNYYLLLLLMHGWLPTACFLALFLHVGGRLFLHGLRERPSGPAGSSFAMTMAGILVAVYFAIATVFLGLNTQPLLFLLLGWGEGYLLFGRRRVVAQAAPSAAGVPALRFARVL